MNNFVNNLTSNMNSSNDKQIFKTINTIPNAKIENEKFPLLLFSHGTGGIDFRKLG